MCEKNVFESVTASVLPRTEPDSHSTETCSKFALCAKRALGDKTHAKPKTGLLKQHNVLTTIDRYVLTAGLAQ